MLFKLNLTKKIIKRFESRLQQIPSKYIEKSIEKKFKSAQIYISFTNFPDEKIAFHCINNLIISQFRNIQKKYECNFFNCTKQIEKAVNEVFTLIPKEYFETNKPILKPNQFALSVCESATGIVLEIESFKRNIGWGEQYKIFESKEDAVNFAQKIIQEKTIECTLYDSNYEFLEVIPERLKN